MADENALAALRELLEPSALRELALRHTGADLEDPDELAPLAAIGLTLRLWRNTELEDAHAGTAARVVRAAGEKSDDPGTEPAAVAVWREARRLRLQADAAETALLRADPSMPERARLRLLRAQLQVGDGIPDDVMFRVNASTSADLEDVVRAALDAPPSDPADWLVGVAMVVWDAERELVVGDSVWRVADVYEALDRDPEDEEDGLPGGVVPAMSLLARYGELVGFDGLVRFLAAAGGVAGRSWAGTPWWPASVDRMAAHAATTSDPWSDEDVQLLLHEPASVRGPVAGGSAVSTPRAPVGAVRPI